MKMTIQTGGCARVVVSLFVALFVSVRGACGAGGALDVQNGGAPDISLTNALDFGQTLVNTSNTLSLAVANEGDALLTITGVSTSGPSAAVFAVVSYPIAIETGGVSNIVVTYSPGTATNHDAVLTVTSDDPDEPSVNVALSGSGVGAFDLIATNGTLQINTQQGIIVHNDGILEITYERQSGLYQTARWTFGDIYIGSDVAISYPGDDRSGILLYANGLGLTATGNITIEHNLNLNGANGGGNASTGGDRTFGSGAGGNDGTSYPNSMHGESGIDRVRRANGQLGSGEGSKATAATRSGGGGGFGGAGGDGNSTATAGGNTIGRLDMADFATADGPCGGSGGGGGPHGSAGAGGGGIQLLAANDVTIASGVTLSADGGEGHCGSPENGVRGGGSGSGGGIRIVADWDNDGDGTLTYSGASLMARGAKALGFGTANSYAGDGGGGRVALRGAAIVDGTTDVSSLYHGRPGCRGETGSVCVDERGGRFSVDGNGLAANAFDTYTSCFVSLKSTLEIGGAGTVSDMWINNSPSSAAQVRGVLNVDVHGRSGVADHLLVSSQLNITDATLDLNEVTPIKVGGLYTIATYGTLVGEFAATNGLPPGVPLEYGVRGNRITLGLGLPGTVLLVR